jgi:FkbM family methyltransferase
MKTISYAQNWEDILLNRVFADCSNGFYVDVGACHPIFHSVTKLFYERGWRGINIEPIPAVFETLARDRVRDVNLAVGLSNREGTMKFYECPAAVGYSTFSPEQEESLRGAGYEFVEHTIPVTTLARVCEQHVGATIDFLKIDAESHEREVLEGADWDRFRPRVVLIEATQPEKWESLLLSADYIYAFFDGLNRYYVRAEDRKLLPLISVPVSVLDDFESFEHRLQVQELQHEVQGLEQKIAEFLESRERARAATADDAQPIEALVETRIWLEEVRTRLERTLAELRNAHARLDLFDGWGPITVGVVRRLRSISSRIPLVKPLLTRAILMRRALLGAAAARPVGR